MSPGGIPPVIHVSQYDSDFTIVFTLFSTVGDFTIESGTTAMVRGTKSSGTGYSADAAINISAKTVTVTGNQQMTAAAGQNVFEITLLKGGKEISSKNFILLCERAALDADTITDESVLKELNAIIESADTATQAAEEAEDAADRAEAAAQTLVIDSTLTQEGQAADAKATGDAIAQIVPGLSETAKAALLNCFAHVAWIDEHGQDYYDALESALYPDAYWDYEWYASSGVLPEGMTAYRYNFTEESGALYAENPVLNFDYIGDCRLMVECKWYCFDEDLTTSEFIEEVVGGNNPQIFALNKANGNQKTGSRVIGHADGQSEAGRDIRLLAGQSQTYYGYKDNVYRVYDLTASGNEYSVALPDDSFSVSGSGLTSQYNLHTGIYSIYPPMTTTNRRTITALFIKSIKFKKFQQGGNA